MMELKLISEIEIAEYCEKQKDRTDWATLRKEAQAKTTIQQVLNELASKCPHGYAEKKWGCTLCEYRLVKELRMEASK
jgi:UDP-galactopyranose mutase